MTRTGFCWRFPVSSATCGLRRVRRHVHGPLRRQATPSRASKPSGVRQVPPYAKITRARRESFLRLPTAPWPPAMPHPPDPVPPDPVPPGPSGLVPSGLVPRLATHVPPPAYVGIDRPTGSRGGKSLPPFIDDTYRNKAGTVPNLADASGSPRRRMFVSSFTSLRHPGAARELWHCWHTRGRHGQHVAHSRLAPTFAPTSRGRGGRPWWCLRWHCLWHSDWHSCQGSWRWHPHPSRVHLALLGFALRHRCCNISSL